MALPTPPFPPSGRFIESVRESSRAVTQAEAITVSALRKCKQFPIFAFCAIVKVGHCACGVGTRITRGSTNDKKLDKRNVQWISNPLCFLPEPCYESGFFE